MAKRESKGQQVKTFKHFEPQPDGRSREVIGKVYFEAGEGMFAIYMPDHIADIVDSLDIKKDGGSGHSSRVIIHSKYRTIRGKIMDEVISTYETVRAQYINSVRLLKADKVLVVYFKRNLAYRKDRPHVFASGQATGGADISFIGSPTIHLDYEVLWKAGNVLYDKIHHEAYGDHPAHDTMRHKATLDGRPEQRHIVPWTQEREDFIAGIKGRLIDLGWLLSDFLVDLEGNMTHAIATGAGLLALAPPPTRQEEMTPGTEEHDGPTLDLQATSTRTRDRRR